MLSQKDSDLKLAYMNSLQLHSDSKKFSFENLERNASIGLQFLEFSRMNLEQEKSKQAYQIAKDEPKKTKYAALAQYHTMEVDFSANSLSAMLNESTQPEDPLFSTRLTSEAQNLTATHLSVLAQA